MPSCRASSEEYSNRRCLPCITLLVAELKAKAAGATSSGVEKFHNVKDRHTRYADGPFRAISLIHRYL